MKLKMKKCFKYMIENYKYYIVSYLLVSIAILANNGFVWKSINPFNLFIISCTIFVGSGLSKIKKKQNKIEVMIDGCKGAITMLLVACIAKVVQIVLLSLTGYDVTPFIYLNY